MTLGVGDSPALRSSFKGQSARITDLDTDHLYRRAVGRRNYLAPCRCKAFVDEASDHVSIEFVGVHEQVLYDTVWSAGEQFQRTALFPSEARFLWARRHTSEGISVVDGRLSCGPQRIQKQERMCNFFGDGAEKAGPDECDRQLQNRAQSKFMFD